MMALAPLPEVAVGPGLYSANPAPATPASAAQISPIYTKGAPQFNRKVSTQVRYPNGDVFEFSALHLNFHIRQSDSQTPNTCDVRVWNIGKTIRQKMQDKVEGARLIIQAGYEGSYGLIFDGEVKYMRTGRSSAADTFLELQCADGDVAYNFGTLNLSLAAGAGTVELINACVQSLKPFGVVLAGFPPNLPSVRFPRGMALYGMTREVLRNVAQLLDCSWTIINKRLTFIPRESYLEGETIELSHATGVVGIPEQTFDGIYVRTLLNPNVHLGRRIHLDNAHINLATKNLSYTGVVQNAQLAKIDKDGFYKVISVDRVGDTRGHPWYNELMLVGVNETVPIAQALRGRVVSGSGGGGLPG